MSSSILEYGVVCTPGVSAQTQLANANQVYAGLREHYKKYDAQAYKVHNGLIQIGFFDSEEPIKALKQVLERTGLVEQVGIYLNFNCGQYDLNNGSYDFHIHEDSKLRESMGSVQFSQTVEALVQNNPVAMVENVLRYPNFDIEQELENSLAKKVKVISMDKSDAHEQIYRNCEHLRESKYRTFQEMLGYRTENAVMFEIENGCEDDTMAHVVLGLGCEFVKVHRVGEERVSKLNEILRLCEGSEA